MTTTTQDVAHAPVRTARPIVIESPEPASRFPVGLWLVLGAIATLGLNIAAVLYIASQMPQ